MGFFSRKQMDMGHITVLEPGKGSMVIKLAFEPTACKAYMVDAPNIPSCRPVLNSKIETSVCKRRYSWFIKISWENLEPGIIEWIANNYDGEEE